MPNLVGGVANLRKTKAVGAILASFTVVSNIHEMENDPNKIALIDCHAHLDQLPDLEESLQRGKTAGVHGIVAVGMNVESNRKVLQIAQANPEYVYPALGYHPWEIREEEIDANLSFVREHIGEGLALGEIGLDYKIKVKTRFQWRVFGELLDMAIEFDRPVIVHSRLSYGRTFEMVKERQVKRAVFHWYSGPVDLLEKIMAAGYFISATPALIYSPPHREAIQFAPIGRILLETDTPVSYEGKESRPEDVQMSLKEVAKLKNLEPSFVAKQTTANAAEFFQIHFRSNYSQ